MVGIYEYVTNTLRGQIKGILQYAKLILPCGQNIRVLYIIIHFPGQEMQANINSLLVTYSTIDHFIY